MLNFNFPAIGDDPSDDELNMFSSLASLMDKVSSCVGVVIEIGNDLKTKGFEEVQTDYIPIVKEALTTNVHPRIILSYATLLWFTDSVSCSILYVVCVNIVSLTPYKALD